VTIGRPREEIFEYLADIANHAEFTDHYLKDWHLTREDSYGLGAGAATLTEMTAPTRIVERGRGGKFNRNRTIGIYELESLSKHHTRVRFTFESLPAKLTDRFLESFGASFYLKRQNSKALRRLRLILEEDRARGKRATVAGGARKPASQYRF
jgi:hypothetical protein